jgi:hypothetical protein
MLSPPVFTSDAQPATEHSLERFSRQIEHDTQLANDTRLPSVGSLLEVRREEPQA